MEGIGKPEDVRSIESNSPNTAGQANDENIFVSKILIFVSACFISMVWLSLVLEYIFVAFDTLLYNL